MSVRDWAVASLVLTVPMYFALAQHGDLVRNGQHLVQLVGDEDDGLAVGAHVAHDLEQAVRLLRGQNSGRLVEDQDLRPAEQDLDDLDGLLL